MKERPILFNGPMVQALLDGRKTMTRRIVKPRKCPDIGCEIAACEIAGEINKPPSDWRFSPYGQPGDRLYVKEAWRCTYPLDKLSGSQIEAWQSTIHQTTADVSLHYDADGAPDLAVFGRYRHARFMPKWASRITLEITDVRVERLQDISAEDAQAEGMFYTDYGRSCFHQGGPPVEADGCPAPESTHPLREGWSWKPTTSRDQCLHTARFAFANLWESINGDGSWYANPWVWVVEFKRIDQPTTAEGE